MSRLPTVGGDAGNWGEVLNDYLSQSHQSDGKLRADVATIAALKALDVSTLPDKMQVMVGGYYAHGDGGGGQFYYDSSSSSTDNGGTVIAPITGSGRWKRTVSDTINVKHFGAKGDGVMDDTAAVQAAVDSALGTVFFPKGSYRLTSVLNLIGNPPSLKGVGKRYNAGINSKLLIDHSGDGIYINGTSHIGVTIDDLTVERSATYILSGINLKYDGLGGPSNIISATNLNRVYVNGGASGIWMRGLVNGTFDSFVCQGQATAGIHFYGTGTSSASNNVTFTDFNIYNVTGGSGILYEGTDCGRSHRYTSGTIENCGVPVTINTGDITQLVQFTNIWFEANSAPMQLKGGRKISFKNLRNAQTGQALIDSSTFAATDVSFDDVMGASVTTVIGVPGVSLKGYERTTKASSLTISAATSSEYRGTVMPKTVSASQVSAESMVGAVRQSGMLRKNYLENWDIGGRAEWTKPGGVTAASDPLGGSEAWSVNASQTITGARQATIPDTVAGQSIEYVVWVYGTGTLEIWNRPDGYAIRQEFNIATSEWTRLTMRYSVVDTVNRATAMVLVFTVANSGDLKIWRPGIYASFSSMDCRPVSAQGGFEGGTIDSSFLVGERQGRNLIVYGTVAPTVGPWIIGDKCFSTAPAAGGNIGWVCTTSGTPGTWKAFGNIAA